ncbi:MAG: hypothetical protein ACRD1J_11580 [Terriglobia bacterium]
MPVPEAHPGAPGRSPVERPQARPLCPSADQHPGARRRAGPTASHWWIVERISMHFRVDWQREQQKTGRPAWQV